MLFQRDKHIKVSKYFELIKPEYMYIRIIPHKSIRNYNSTNIMKTICQTYRKLTQRIHREQKKIFFETNFKISYVIDIENNNVNFYFIIPKPFFNIIIEKIKEIWSKATIEVVDGIKPFNTGSSIYQLAYEKEDALSLNVDKKSNEPLNSIMNVLDIMKKDDRLTIIYNFLPCSQFGWLKQYEDTIQKIKDKKPVNREKMTFEYIMKNILCVVVEFLDVVVEVINDFFDSGNKNKNRQTLAEIVATALEQSQEISLSTKRKKELNVIDTQIAIVSDSNNNVRKETNALSICQSYRILDEDNQLKHKKLNTEIDNIEKYRFDKIEINTFSTDECQNFIQIPGRNLLKEFNLQHIQVEETSVPQKLQNGYINLGEVKFKGNKQNAFLEDEYNIGNLPLCLIGSQGSGKTTYLSKYSNYANNKKEGIVLIDFIKNCELADNVSRAISDKDKVVIDLSKEECLQGLGFNEIKITDDMTAYKKMKLANLQAQQTMAIIDSINSEDSPLTSKMRRYLSASANITYALGYTSIRDVISCLQDHNVRLDYMKSLLIDSELSNYLIDEINALNELNEINKIGEVSGTRDSKIEGILDRINLLKEDFKLKYMFNKNCDDNIDFVELMEDGKIVIIKIPEIEFPLPYIKNVLVTYFISKIWLSSQIRGSLHAKPKRSHVIIDEIFQAPTSMRILKYILPQSRKFGCKFVFSIQYIKQIDEMFESLQASGSSFMLLKGTRENDFKTFKSLFGEYEYEDIIEMEQFSSLNLIYYSDGYASFISKLPY